MSRAAAGKFRTSAHRVFRIFVCRDQLVCVGRDSDDSYRKKESRCDEEPADQGPLLLIAAEAYEKRNHIYGNHDGQIICDLYMVGLYLHAEGECEQGGSQHGLREP